MHRASPTTVKWQETGMGPSTIALVKESHGWVVPIAEQAAEIFYERLFSTTPGLRPLFKGDIKDQGRKLMATIAIVVDSLDRLDDVLPAVKALAVRHVSYGVRDEDYDAVGAALIWTLVAGLGDRFTEAHKAAWIEIYGALSSIMREAASKRQTAAE
jgi:hemoglobin-like flavoprotein